MSDYFKLLHEEKSYLQALKESTQVKIPVKHPGVLEVPEGKNVEDLSYDHFAALAKKKGFEKISKALTNLHTWNKERDPKLSSWADKMQARLSAEFSEKANEAEEIEKDENKDEVKELDIHQPNRGQVRGGFGSIAGKTTRGGFGSIAGRPQKEEDEVEELDIHQPDRGTRGGFGSIAGKSTRGGFGSIKGRPIK